MELPQDILASFIGQEFDFYGVDGYTFCIGKNGSRMAIEATDDPSDGYRSYFGSFVVSEVGKIFFGTPIASVILLEVEQAGSDHRTGWKLVDTKTNHCWLMIGTDYSDDYYPWFVFDYVIPGDAV